MGRIPATTTCTRIDPDTQQKCGRPAVEAIGDSGACETHRMDPGWRSDWTALDDYDSEPDAPEGE